MFLISMQHIQYDKQLKQKSNIWYVNNFSFTAKYLKVQHNKEI